MPSMSKEIEVDAPREAVWAVVADIDNEPEYWHGTREVRNIRREGDLTDRVVVQNFMGTKVTQRVRLNPTHSVEVEYLSGTTVGKKTVAIEEAGDSRQRIRVTWNVRFTGLLWLITPVIKNHILKGTENALQRIKQVAEERAGPGEIQGTP
jgi:carbon monoxide dehydrogenase subunit G